jgi:hypothetical protein
MLSLHATEASGVMGETPRNLWFSLDRIGVQRRDQCPAARLEPLLAPGLDAGLATRSEALLDGPWYDSLRTYKERRCDVASRRRLRSADRLPPRFSSFGMWVVLRIVLFAVQLKI